VWRWEKYSFRWADSHRGRIPSKPLQESIGDRHKAVLAELTFPNRQDSRTKIHIADSQAKSLPTTQSTAIKNAEQRRKHHVPLSGTAVGTNSVNRGEELSHLVTGEHVGDEVVLCHRRLPTARDVCLDPVAHEEFGKATHGTDILLAGLRRLVWLPNHPTINHCLW
jgi:hypothetical protein